MDTNWFYSTLAQSSSAIVGLFGALLFSYLVNVAKKLSTDKDSLEELLQRWRIESIDAIDIANIPSEATPEQRAALEAMHADLEGFLGLKTYGEFKALVDSIEPRLQALPRKMNRGRMDFRMRNARAFTRFMRYNTRVLPNSIRILYFILVSMMLSGVILPITQLSGFQSVVFTLFTMSLSALFIWLGYEILFVHPSKMRARVRK
jgi:hypothetical protein